MGRAHGPIDFTAEVFIVHGGRVLLRRHDKGGAWLSVGGHVEPGEDPNEAALREVREEVGLAVELWDPDGIAGDHGDGVRDLVPPRYLSRHPTARPVPHEHVTFVYFARSPSDRVVQGDTERSEEWRWFTRDELDEPRFGLRPNIRFYARAALEALSR
jgi:8-oxo-dGTP pyrophosphatase MutT (NUDIX family)